MSSLEKISVIIPVYNAENTIVQALDSILNQTYPVFEIILVNDGSKDNSEAIILNYKKNNAQVNIEYYSQKNQGPSVARNLGIKKSKGDYITFLDSDDYWINTKNELQMKAFSENKDVYLVGGNRIGFNKTNIPINSFNVIPFSKILIANRFHTPAVTIKKEVFDKIGYFNESLKYSEDYNLWLRIISEFKGGFINSEVFKYNDNGGINDIGLSGNIIEMEKGELYNYKELKKLNKISTLTWLSLSIYSLLKFLRRWLKQLLR